MFRHVNLDMQDVYLRLHQCDYNWSKDDLVEKQEKLNHSWKYVCYS